MKAIKYLSMMLVVLLCSMGFVGCSDDDDDGGTNTIYGTWVQTNSYGYEIRITFNGNGTGSFSVTDVNGESTTGTFEFDYDKSEKEITILSSSPWAEKNLVGTWDVTVTPSTLQLSDYYVYQFKRG